LLLGLSILVGIGNEVGSLILPQDVWQELKKIFYLGGGAFLPKIAGFNGERLNSRFGDSLGDLVKDLRDEYDELMIRINVGRTQPWEFNPPAGSV